MKTLRERILEGLASLRQETPKMTAEEQKILEDAERVARGETAATNVEKTERTEPAAPAAQNAVLDLSANPSFQALKAQNDALMQQLGALTTAMQGQTAKAQLDKDNAKLDSLVRQMRMTPAQAESWRKVAADNPTAFQAALPALEAGPVLRQLARDGVKTVPASDGNAGEQIVALTQKRMKETKEDMATAMKAVCAEHPELAAAHQASAPSVSAS